MSAATLAQRPPGGGGGKPTTKPWDTDNLVYTQGTVSYSAENFRVPFHQYRGYRTAAGASSAAREACAPGGIADAFFQTDSGRGRNDFPVLASNTAGTVWSETATGSKTSGCAAFVDAQITMASRARSNGGYYLDSQGNLKLEENVSSARFLRDPASRTRTYGTWSASRPARTGYQSLSRASASDSAIPATVKTYGILAHTANSPGCRSQAGGLALANGDADPYLARTDNSLPNRGTSGSYERASSPQPSGAWEPSAAAISTQNEFVIRSGTVWYALAHRDGEVLPGWAEAARNPTPVTLDGINAGDGDGFGEIVREESPLGCRMHNVFFEASELDKGKAVHGWMTTLSGMPRQDWNMSGMCFS